jgi:hypothetical protein
MIPRDWTLTDQADAADAERDRRWWRTSDHGDPWWPDDLDEPDEEGDE